MLSASSGVMNPSVFFSKVLQHDHPDIPDIAERIACVYRIVKTLQDKNLLKNIRDRNLRKQVDQANNDIYGFLKLIHAYVTDYYGYFQALDIHQREDWSAEEKQEKTKEFLFKGAPSLISRVVASMKTCVDHMATVLVVR